MWGEQLAAAITSGGLSLLGTQLQGIQNRNLAAQQNEYNLDMWRLQNEYNSPLAQRRRMEEAGFNPNLFYSMGTAGNSSQAPQKVAPQPVDYQGLGKELGKIFNLENIKTIHANRLEAEANAKRADALAKSTAIDALRNRDIYDAEIALGSDYSYDPKTGKYVFTGTSGDPTTRKHPVGMGEYYLKQKLAENYQRSELIPSRLRLLGNQADYLQPQIWMSNYEKSYYPYSYWIGQGSKVVGSLGNILPKWKFSRNSGSPLSTRTEYRYNPTTNNINNYSPF